METLSNLASLKGSFGAELSLMIASVALVLLSFKTRRDGGRLASFVAVGFIVLALLLTIATPADRGIALFEGMIAHDAFARFFKIVILASALVAASFAEDSYDLRGISRGEFYAFLVALTLGLCVMCSANDLLMMYLAVETASIVSYVMAGYLSCSRRSEEAGLKYVFYGGMASGVMIFGLSLMYGLTGTLNLVEIREYLTVNPTDRVVLFVTFIFVLTGLGYKMAVAPFHMWSPDVYEGAPIAVTAFLSVASKAAGFALALRFFLVGFTDATDPGSWVTLKALDWRFLIAVLAAFTMSIGNLVALRQDNIKRFLAYSSVAHAGYMLMGLAALNKAGLRAILFYFAAYFLMNLGAFLSAILVANRFGTEDMRDYKGLGRRGGFGFMLSFCLSVFLLSLTGIPPFAGFVAKWYVFGAVIAAGPDILWLAVVGAMNAVVSLFYYVRLVKFMYFYEPSSADALDTACLRHKALLVAFAGFTLVLGLFFGPLAGWVESAASLAGAR